MPKAKPISLHPLSLDEALRALLKVDPDKVGLTKKKREKPKEKKK